MKKHLFSLCLLLLFVAGMQAQRIQQPLGRGVVAVHRGAERSVTSGTEGDLVSWRRLAQEPDTTRYRVYMDGTLVCETQATCYVPTSLNEGTTFRVVPVIGGKEDPSTAG